MLFLSILIIESGLLKKEAKDDDNHDMIKNYLLEPMQSRAS